MYADNPSYFNTPQTTYGVRRTGPVHVAPTAAPIQRYRPMGTLSADGKIIPAPIHSALSGITYGNANGNGNGEGNGEGEGEGMAPWMTYSLYGVGGIVAGYALYLAYQKFAG